MSCSQPPAKIQASADADTQPGWSIRAKLADVDLTTVWGVGDDVYAAGAGAMIAHSGDRGTTFQLLESGVTGQPRFHAFSGSSATDVWMLGDDGAGRSLLLHSADHGASWQPRELPAVTDPRAIWSLDEQRVLIATGAGQIVLSFDGGTSWSVVFDDNGTSVAALWATASGVVYAAGAVIGRSAAEPGTSARAEEACDGGGALTAVDGGMGQGAVWRSVDGGASWASVGVSTPGPLYSIWGGPDGSFVLAIGMNSSVATTSDAGGQWLEHGAVADVPALDLTDVWVGPSDGALFFASSGGLVRGVGFDCKLGSVQLAYEEVPSAADGSHGVAAVWGSSSDDVWAVGTGGTIRHRP